MQLIKRGSGDLPVRFLVEIAQRHSVGQQQVELLSHFQTNRFLQIERQRVRNGAVGLDLAGTLMNERLRIDVGSAGGDVFLRHEILLISKSKSLLISYWLCEDCERF